MGIGPADPIVNPLAAAAIPTLQALLGGARPVAEDVGVRGIRGQGIALVPVDANLDVPGRPQSGTGQTALLTGRNASLAIGRHFGPWVPSDLRELLARENLFVRARQGDLRVVFANAYPRGHFAPGGRGSRRPAAIPLAADAAGVLDRDEESLRQGQALASSIDTVAWRRYVDPHAPPISPAAAGRLLADLTAESDLTLFAHYDTDYAGHRRDLDAGIASVERIDAFLAGLLPALPADTLLLMVSDHGNLEDVRGGHTRNAVPLLAVGPGAGAALEHARALTDVAPLILELLGVVEGGGDGDGDWVSRNGHTDGPAPGFAPTKPT